MGNRITLAQQIERDKHELDPAVEQAFVKEARLPTGDKRSPTNENPYLSDATLVAQGCQAKPGAAMSPGLIAVNVRIRPELARGLKTASLERQMQGIEPCSKREIVEAGLEHWLRTHGYLTGG